jgi:hypothetical protein
VFDLFPSVHLYSPEWRMEKALPSRNVSNLLVDGGFTAGESLTPVDWRHHIPFQ